MKKIILFLLLITLTKISFAKENKSNFSLFMKFIKQHNKQYESIEQFNEKFNIFIENIENLRNSIENYDYSLFSPFMDITRADFKKRSGWKKPTLVNTTTYIIKNNNFPIPENFDWREKNVVTKVKDQGNCGSCWTFSTTGNIESLYAIKNNKLVELSEQQLVDCDKYDSGCDGADGNAAYLYLSEVGGLMRETDYPYKAKDQSCKFNKDKVEAEVLGFKVVSKDEDEIAKILVENGPLNIGLNSDPLMYYTKGILRPSKLKKGCDPKEIDHAMLIVGFGEENGVKFWIVKNSFGKNWGESGYLRIERGVGACGINLEVSTAIVK